MTNREPQGASKSFGHWLLKGKERSAEIAVISGQQSLTYRELSAAVEAVSKALEGHPAERPVVAILSGNAPGQIAAYLGALASGALVVPMTDWSEEAFRSVWAEVQPDVVYADAAGLERLETLQLGGAAVLGDDHQLSGAAAPRQRPPLPPEVRVIVYTSGSTGRPRGVMVSESNLRANTQACIDFVRLTPGDRGFLTMPIAYCYGASVLHAHLRVGASVALAKLSFPEAALDALEAVGATGLPGVPATFQMLLQRSTLAKRALKSLRYLTISGGRLPDESLRALAAAVPAAEVVSRYGTTESTSIASYLPPDRLAEKLGSIGRGLPGSPLHVERPDGVAVPPGSGETGEIVLRGEHVTLGYYADPDETAARFRGNAYHTGDLATVDADGFVYVVGREREFVKSMGHRVSPQEVEAVLSSFPGVAAAAVFGAPDALRGEALVALIVERAGESVDDDELTSHCADRLPPWKVPFEIHRTDQLPVNAAGKVQRRALARPSKR